MSRKVLTFQVVEVMNRWEQWILIRERNRLRLSVLLIFFIGVGTILVLKLWHDPGLLTPPLVPMELQVPYHPQMYLNSSYHNEDDIRLNPNLTHILVLGIDRWGEVIQEEIAGHAGRADVVLLLTLDQVTESISLLSISRDSMVPVSMIDVFGIVYGTVFAQLGYQFAYGDGAMSSVFAMRRIVSQLLMDLPIHGTVAFQVCAVQQINETMGGISLTFPRDFLYIDETFKKGHTVTLTNEQAERFVQFRDIEVVYSNVGRMERQEIFIAALLTQIRDLAQGSRRVLLDLYEQLEAYTTTDVRAEDLLALSHHTWSDRVYTLPGELIAGEVYDEFHICEIELRELLLQLYYVPVT